jgi:quercetin dioxygenase-like cupin family protein
MPAALLLAGGPGVTAAVQAMIAAPRLVALARQPEVTKFTAEADGIEVRHVVIHKAGTVIPQHAHKFPHLTVVAAGSVRLWLDGTLKGDTRAPGAIMIGAGTKHLIMALEDGTVIECVHNVSRSGEIEIADEHLPAIGAV